MKKRIISLVLITVLLVSAVGCGKQSGDEAIDNVVTSSAQTTAVTSVSATSTSTTSTSSASGTDTVSTSQSGVGTGQQASASEDYTEVIAALPGEGRIDRAGNLIDTENFKGQTVYDGTGIVPEYLFKKQFTENEDNTNRAIYEEYGDTFLEERAEKTKQNMEAIFGRSYKEEPMDFLGTVFSALTIMSGLPFIDSMAEYERNLEAINELGMGPLPIVITGVGLYDFYNDNGLVTEAEFITDESLIYRLESKYEFDKKVLGEDFGYTFKHGEDTNAPTGCWAERGVLCITFLECKEDKLEEVADLLELPTEKIELGKEYRIIYDIELGTTGDYNNDNSGTFTAPSVDDWDVVTVKNIGYEEDGEAVYR